MSMHPAAAAGVRSIQIFQCPVCKHPYLERDMAEACSMQPYLPRFQPGNVVTGFPERYGWFESESWVAARRPNTPRDPATISGERFTFFYVVTAVDVEASNRHTLSSGEHAGFERFELDRRWLGAGVLHPHRIRYHLYSEALVNSEEKKTRPFFTFDDVHSSLALVENPPVLPVPDGIIGTLGKHYG